MLLCIIFRSVFYSDWRHSSSLSLWFLILFFKLVSDTFFWMLKLFLTFRFLFSFFRPTSFSLFIMDISCGSYVIAFVYMDSCLFNIFLFQDRICRSMVMNFNSLLFWLFPMNQGVMIIFRSILFFWLSSSLMKVYFIVGTIQVLNNVNLFLMITLLSVVNNRCIWAVLVFSLSTICLEC